MRHGAYARPQAIPRGVLLESQKEVEAYVEAIVAAFAPRDALELVVARRIARSDLGLARLERYECVALGRVSRLRPDLGEIPDHALERAAGLVRIFSSAAFSLRQAIDMGVDLETWVKIADAIWEMHNVPYTERPDPDVDDEDETAPAIWRQFVLEVLLPRYWNSIPAAIADLEATAQKWAERYQAVEGKAEERAVAAALAKGGPVDSVSLLRARVQREGDRDRATYAKLQQRILPDDEEVDAP